jgi:hypothetical protein
MPMRRQFLLIAATRATAPEVRVLADSFARVDPTAPRTIVVLGEDPYSHALIDGFGETPVSTLPADSQAASRDEGVLAFGALVFLKPTRPEREEHICGLETM